MIKIFILCCFVLSAVKADFLADLCKKIEDGSSGVCKESIPFPEPIVKMCRTCGVPIPDPCHTHTTVTFPCGVSCTKSLKCNTKMCSKQACVPGFKKECTNLPCGLKWKTDHLSICHPKVSPGVDAQKIDTKHFQCSCLDALQTAVEGGVGAFLKGDVDDVYSRAITAVVSAQTCIDNFLGLMNNEGQVGEELGKEATDQIVKLPPLDLNLMEDFVVRIILCVATEGEQCDKIGLRVIDYLDDSKDSLIDGLKEYGTKLRQHLEEPFLEGARLANQVKGNLTEAQSLAGTVAQTCAGDSIGAKSTIDNIVQQMKALQELADTIGVLENLISLKNDLENIFMAANEIASGPETATVFKNIFSPKKKYHITSHHHHH